MDTIQIIVFGGIVLVISLLSAVIIAYFSPRKDKNIDLTTTLLENGDLDLNDLDEKDLKIVNKFERNEIYGHLL